MRIVVLRRRMEIAILSGRREVAALLMEVARLSSILVANTAVVAIAATVIVIAVVPPARSLPPAAGHGGLALHNPQRHVDLVQQVVDRVLAERPLGQPSDVVRDDAQLVDLAQVALVGELRGGVAVQGVAHRREHARLLDGLADLARGAGERVLLAGVLELLMQ